MICKCKSTLYITISDRPASVIWVIHSQHARAHEYFVSERYHVSYTELLLVYTVRQLYDVIANWYTSQKLEREIFRLTDTEQC